MKKISLKISALTSALASALTFGIVLSQGALANTTAHGLTDGLGLNPQITNLSKQFATPFGLTDEQIQTLSEHITWQRLLLIKKGKSQIDDGGFFLAKGESKGEPKSELIAMLHAMQAKNSDILCQFPARTHFLSQELQKLGVAVGDLQKDCTGFNQWASNLDGQALSLIFAEEHPNSMSSMYGHAFLRLDTTKSVASGQDKDAIAINYSSVVTDKKVNEGVRAVKSMFGGYAGGLEFINFADKQDDYLVDDERDIWQYTIALTKDEIDQIIRHLWETRESGRRYYFTHNNCATEIVRLIDVVRADKSIGDDMGSIVIPSQIAHILDKHGMVAKTKFLPSNATKRQALINNGSDFDLAKLAPNRNNPIHATPRHRLGVSVGHDDRTGATYGLSVRSAYQDLLDKSVGVRPFLDLKILSADVSYDDEKLKIKEATLFSTRSYNPTNTAKNNAKQNANKGLEAWGLHLNALQAVDASSPENADHLVLNTTIEKGKSWTLGQAPHGTGDLADTLCYVFGQASGQLGKVNQGYRVGVGMSAGCSHRASERFRLLGELSVPYWYHHDTSADRSGYVQPSVNVGMQYDVSRTHAVRLTGQVQKNHGDTHENVRLELLRYF